MSKSKKTSTYWLIALFTIMILTVIDQYTKHLVTTHLKGTSGVDLIPGVFRLEYLENHGAAFGILQNQQWLFIALCVVFLLAGGYFYSIIPKTRKYLPLNTILVVLVAGACGNLIDRLFYGYVIDFLYFSLINFPIFNVADCYVTVSTFFLAIYILFKYKEEDFYFLSKKGRA